MPAKDIGINQPHYWTKTASLAPREESGSLILVVKRLHQLTAENGDLRFHFVLSKQQLDNLTDCFTAHILVKNLEGPKERIIVP